MAVENLLTLLYGEKQVGLESLLGEHFLSGVSRDKIQIPNSYNKDEFEEASSFSFALDGVVFTAIEDPNDGYRSSMDRLFIGGEIKETFPRVKVFCSMKPNSEYEKNEVLQMIDVVSEKIILSVGTGNTDDYYPFFVAEWDPTALYLNRELTFGD